MFFGWVLDAGIVEVVGWVDIIVGRVVANIGGWIVVALDGVVAIGWAAVVSVGWATVRAGDTGEVEDWIAFVAEDVSWVVTI